RARRVVNTFAGSARANSLRGRRSSLMLRRMRKRILLAALLLVSLVCVGFARQARERTAWEYHVTCARIDFNKVGADGWELVTATQDGTVTCLYFKRPK
ncbi:MAG: hypothetical protein ABW250_21270, partial [Pyrinomonadaceae bacterium]